MPLSFVNENETVAVMRINGTDDSKRLLTNLGVVEGSEIKVISKASGNCVLRVKETKIAISAAMASRIIVGKVN